MINNDKIFSSESYNFDDKLKRLAEYRYDTEIDEYVDNEKSEESISKLIIGGLIFGPYVILALLLLCGSIFFKIAERKDKNELKKLYKKHKSEIDKIVNNLKKRDFIKDLLSIKTAIKTSKGLNSSEFDIFNKDNLGTDILSGDVKTNEDFIKKIIIPELIKSIKSNKNSNKIKMKLEYNVVPIIDPKTDLVNYSKDSDKCSDYNEKIYNRINKIIEDTCIHLKLQNFNFANIIDIKPNPDECYEDFDNGHPVEVTMEFIVKLD